jgi:hypothetical protein
MKIKAVSFSDVHLGHGRVLPHVIHTNIKKVIYPQLNDELDILFLVGDFFDGLLDMNGQAGWVAACIIGELIEFANHHQFLIRIVRGTFSHDRMQNQFFETESDPTYIGEDLLVRVFDSISIEHLNGLDIDVMYVPDDLPCDNAMEVVKEMISEHQLQNVDILLNHGYFSHLLPKGIPHEPPNTFQAENFDELVKGFILNGHIHQPSVYRKVISNGSFERLCHGEEEPKGFFVIYYNTESNECTHEFIENTLATTFKTFDLTKWRTEADVLIEYGKWLQLMLDEDISTSDPIFVRIICDDAMLRQAVLTFTRERNDNIILSSKKSNRNSDEDGEDICTSTVDLPIITEDNLSGMIVEFLSTVKKIDISKDEVEGVLYHE